MAVHNMSHAESVDVNCTPQDAWNTLRQLDRMGEWSPENHGGTWKTGDGSSVGDEFDGVNRIGDREWIATATITRTEPGVALTWRVGDPGTDWGYLFEAIDGGTRITETWEVNELPQTLQSYSAEQLERRRANVIASMQTTLQNLKATLEN